MQGLEFIVSFDPLEAAAQSNPNRFDFEPNNIWVIRKQERRKRSGMEDEMTVIATYFVVGDTIYMAPSVASVVGNRIVSCNLCGLEPALQVVRTLNANSPFFFQLTAVTSLSRLLKTASTLPTFTPSTGHTYLPPTARTTEPGQQASQQSKENTPMPDATQSSAGETQSTGKAGLGVTTTSSTFKDTRNLAEAFHLFTKYGDEFMDEQPLTGEPGSFILSRVGESDRAAGAAEKPASKATLGTGMNTPSGLRGRSTTPQVRIDTPGKASEKSSAPPTPGDSKGKKKKNRIAS
jgi:mediator of RNA polymerase II transcription subunit 6